MALKSLFDLDPTRFGIKAGAGAFKRVADIGQKQLSLADLIGDLQAPTVPTNIPKVTPIDTNAINSFMSTFVPAKSMRTSLVNQMTSNFGQFDWGSWLDQRLTGQQSPYDWDEYPMGSEQGRAWEALKYTVQPAYDPYRSIYNTGNPQYNNTYKPQIDTYNQEVAAYKSVVDPFKAQLDAYNTEAQRRIRDANVGLVNPSRVDKRAAETSGDILAESALYSENLHNLMIDRVSAQPQIDEMSALFSKGK